MANNTISGAVGTDLITIKGSRVSDLLIVNGDGIYIDGLEGDDTISSSSGVEQLIIEGGADDDKLIFDAEILGSLLNLGIGNDNVKIEDFSGTINGGLGKDSITNSTTRTIKNSIIRGEAGEDIFKLGNILP